MESKEGKYECYCNAPCIPGEMRCTNGHDGVRCPIDNCNMLKIYGFCFIHDREELKLEKCPICVCPLVGGYCKNDHSRKSEVDANGYKKEIEESKGEEAWKTNFLAIVKSKMSV